MNWRGRQLMSLVDNTNAKTITYLYDADGLRGSKTVNNAKTTYTYVGDKLCYQHTANVDGSTNYELYFFYDSTGALSVIQYYVHSGETVTGYTYYVLCNTSGDVLGLYDGNGVLRVSYEYDAWGNVISVEDANGTTITNTNSIAHRNPIRYRGYYYDVETGFYYLQSRYYCPKIGRFLNADAVIANVGGNLKGYNMFAYCFNNPTNMDDQDGNWPKWVKKATSWVKKRIINPIKGFVSDILTVRHDVPLYDQGETDLCWAYSQTMIEDFNSGITRTQEEADDRAEELGRALHGTDWNRSGRPQNAVSIGTPSITELYIRLNVQGPLYASYGLYDDSGTRLLGHAIVITGVDVVNGIVYTNNPSGVQGEQSYDDFLQIFAGGNNSSWHLDNCYYLS